jgi:pilus assembly protein CpaF
MRPDRIVIGEVRGAEAWDLVQALTTGHRGSWSTIHADSSQDALVRLESLALTSGVAVPHGVLRTQIGRSIDALIQLERRGDVRRIASITRVTPSESHGWVLEDVSS